nr:GDCCVxC domain-containing (seleno)protein [uncultured Glaciecola sp.]
MSKIDLTSTITCPHCQHSQAEIMPTDACQFFYQCTSCKSLIKPLSGDCCVYCSYGTVKCPPIQEGNACCGV